MVPLAETSVDIDERSEGEEEGVEGVNEEEDEEYVEVVIGEDGGLSALIFL